MYNTPPTCVDIQWPSAGIWLPEKSFLADYVTHVSCNAS